MTNLVWGLHNWQFWLSGFFFLFIIIFFIFPLGFLLLRWTKLSLKWRFYLALPFGLIIWGLISWLGSGISQLGFDQSWGWFKNGLWLNYLLIAFATLVIIIYRQDFTDLHQKVFISTKQPQQIRPLITMFVLVVVGLIIQLPAVFGSGLLNSKNGVPFFFTNIPDGVMHLSFIESMKTTLPPVRPEIQNQPLLDYHYFSDLVQSRLSQVFHLPTFNLFFQFMPSLLSIWTTVLIFQITYDWTKKWHFSNQKTKKPPSLVPAIFVTLTFLLAGDGTFLMELLWRRRFNFGTPTFDNGAEQFLNMPQMYAKLVFFMILIFWQNFAKIWSLSPIPTQKNSPLLKKKPTNSKNLTKKTKSFSLKTIFCSRDLVLGFFLIISTALLSYYKVYFAVLFLGGCGFATLYLSWKNRRQLSQVLPDWFFLIITAVLAFLIIQSGSSHSGTFEPLSWNWTWPKIIVGDSHLGMGIWLLEEETFLANNIISKVIRIRLKYILTALVAIYGVRLLGIFPLKKTRQILNPVFLFFFIPCLLIFTLAGMNLIQVKGGLNTFNFFIITCIGLNFLFGLNLAHLWLTDSKIKYVLRPLVIILLILASLRTGEKWSYNLKTTFNQKADVVFSESQLQAYSFIRSNTSSDSLFQTIPLDGYNTYSSAFSAFTSRSTYLSGQNILETHDLDFNELEKNLIDAWSKTNLNDFQQAFHQLEISYIYLNPEEKDKIFKQLSINAEDWLPVFINDELVLFKIP